MFRKRNVIAVTSLTLVFLLISACSLSSPPRQAGNQEAPKAVQKAGVQLWADNCARCHNIRPPESYSDAQWDVAVLHMRVRANLAADDARAIVDYLKSAN